METQNQRISFNKYTEEEVKAVFGPSSDSRRAVELQKREPKIYAEMKQSAAYVFRLIPESTIPFANRISKADLEESYRQEKATERDELVPMPDQLADRLGVPRGTKKKFEDLKVLMGKA